MAEVDFENMEDVSAFLIGSAAALSDCTKHIEPNGACIVHCIRQCEVNNCSIEIVYDDAAELSEQSMYCQIQDEGILHVSTVSEQLLNVAQHVDDKTEATNGYVNTLHYLLNKRQLEIKLLYLTGDLIKDDICEADISLTDIGKGLGWIYYYSTVKRILHDVKDIRTQYKQTQLLEHVIITRQPIASQCVTQVAVVARTQPSELYKCNIYKVQKNSKNYTVIIDAPDEIKCLAILHRKQLLTDDEYACEVNNFMDYIKHCLFIDGFEDECTILDEWDDSVIDAVISQAVNKKRDSEAQTAGFDDVDGSKPSSPPSSINDIYFRLNYITIMLEEPLDTGGEDDQYCQWTVNFNGDSKIDDKQQEYLSLNPNMIIAALKQAGLVGHDTCNRLAELSDVDGQRGYQSLLVLNLVMFVLGIIKNSNSKISEAVYALKARASRPTWRDAVQRELSDASMGLQLRFKENSKNLKTLPDKSTDDVAALISPVIESRAGGENVDSNMHSASSPASKITDPKKKKVPTATLR